MCFHHLPRFGTLLTALSAMRTQYCGTISQGLKYFKLHNSQRRMNVLISSAEVWKAPNYIIRNAKWTSWYHLIRSGNLQNQWFAMQNQCCAISCWGLKWFKLYPTQCEINVLVSSAEVWNAPNYIVHNEKSMIWYQLEAQSLCLATKFQQATKTSIIYHSGSYPVFCISLSYKWIPPLIYITLYIYIYIYIYPIA